MKILFVTPHNYNINSPLGCHHYARLFLNNGNQIFWLNRPISFLHLLKFKNNDFVKDNFKNWLNSGFKTNDGVFQYTPLTMLPYSHYVGLNNEWVLNRMLYFTIPLIKKILKFNKFDEVDVIWIEDPYQVEILNIVKHKVSIFRIGDDFLEFKNAPKGCKKIIDFIIENTDLTFYTSIKLIEKYSSLKKSAIYLSNGVDYDYFNKKNLCLPIEYYSIPSPRIVYVGAIESWFDKNLIEFAAEALPYYSFVLIGKVNIDLSNLKNFKNIFILGQRKYNEIPGFLKYSNLGIIPFLKNNLTSSVNPIKLYEYFSVGLPVLSVKLDGIVGLNSPCYFYSDKNEFIKRIELIIKSKLNKKVFLNFAISNAWSKRFDLVTKSINQILTKNGATFSKCNNS